jgi:hypothetical protein
VKFLKPILALFLANIFLFSTAGISLHKHLCLISGETEVSFVPETKACCAKKEEAPQKKKKCCENPMQEAEVQFQVDCCVVSSFAESLEVHNDLPRTIQSPEAPLAAAILVYQLPAFSTKTCCTATVQDDPPLSGREILSKHQLLRI